MALTDELVTGVVPSGAPELLSAFGVSPARAAGWTLVAFGVLGALLEPPLLALAHGRRERPLRTAGLLLMAATALAAALVPSYALLLVALAFYGPASGVGVNLAQAALVAANPHRREVVLARWSLFGEVGDLLAPAVLAVSVALGLGLRGALIAAAALALVQALAAWRAPVAGDDAEPEAPRPRLREALRSRPLVGWSLAAVLCGLMDEVLVSFGALHLAQRLGMGAGARAVILSAWVVGALLGAALLERLAARVRPAALLVGSGAWAALAYAAWLGASTPLASTLTLGLAGLFAAAHYPLLRARAYASVPEQPHLVLAVGALTGTLDLLLPLAVGAVADGAGLGAAMLVLLLQPLGVVVAGLFAARGASR